MSNVVVLNWLVNEVNVDLLAVGPLVQAFADAGFTTEEQLWSMTKEQAASVVSDGGTKRKVLAAIKRGPRKEVAGSPAKKRKKSSTITEPVVDPVFEPPPPVHARDLCGSVSANRSPVMILWAAVVARETLGSKWSEALSLASTVASLNAAAKASSIWGNRGGEEAAPTWCEDGSLIAPVNLLGRSDVPACRLDNGEIRGISKGRAVHPASARDNLERAFGSNLSRVHACMTVLARMKGKDAFAFDPRLSYALYESFRPDVPSGAGGWGAKGQLSLDLVVEMAGDWAQNMAKFDGVVVAEVKKEEVGGGGLQCVKREEEGGGNVVPDVKLEGMQGEKGAQGCLASATEGVDGDVFGEEDDLGDAIVAEIAKAGPQGLKQEELETKVGPGAQQALLRLREEGIVYDRQAQLLLL